LPRVILHRNQNYSVRGSKSSTDLFAMATLVGRNVKEEFTNSIDGGFKFSEEGDPAERGVRGGVGESLDGKISLSSNRGRKREGMSRG